MYGPNNITGASAAANQKSVRQQMEAGAAAGTLGGGIPPAPSASEISFELDGLHGVLDRLTSIKNDLRHRLAPVSASMPDIAECGQSANQALPSSDIARTIRGAGQRVHTLCQELEEAIALLRC